MRGLVKHPDIYKCFALVLPEGNRHLLEYKIFHPLNVCTKMFWLDIRTPLVSMHKRPGKAADTGIVPSENLTSYFGSSRQPDSMSSFIHWQRCSLCSMCCDLHIECDQTSLKTADSRQQTTFHPQYHLLRQSSCITTLDVTS